jgi:hypothetical protein
MVLCGVIGLLTIFGCSKESNPAKGANPAIGEPLNSGVEEYALVAQRDEETVDELVVDVVEMVKNFDFENTAQTGGLGKSMSEIGAHQWQTWTYNEGWWFCNDALSLLDDTSEVARWREDSVQYTDRDGLPIQCPSTCKLTGGTIIHHEANAFEHYTRGYVNEQRDWHLTASIDQKCKTYLVLNGTLFQIFQAEDINHTEWCNFQAEATVTDLTLKIVGKCWSKPISGTIRIVSRYKITTIEFNTCTAHITVTDENGVVISEKTIRL